jgi:SHS2 domain-containing protein
MKRFEFLEHTADIGLKITGNTPNQVFEYAAEGLYALALVEQPKSASEKHSFTVTAKTRDELLLKYMEELVFLLYGHKMAAAKLKVKLGRNQAEVTGDFMLVPAKAFALEIKSPTYHHLKFEKTDKGYQAVVYFDL